eukprot:TRINITY_DN454_c2_g1_i1.p1 TRINITY_DN454_c2_g1~~TRINITY_DN454_c2_g1_i1.p1  ORF type:complete len:522 (+),score=137.97 TRINITY_DN454_c2_g1_i1:214-1779(+)
MWYSGRATAGGADPVDQPPLRRRNTGSKQTAGIALDSLLHFRPTHTSVEDNMREALHMLDILPPDQRKGFMQLFSAHCQTRSCPAIVPAKVQHPPPEMLINLEDIPECPGDQALRHELLDKVVILKLNGGLGTSMGCKFPKSAIEVRSDLSFLDLTVRQVEYLNSMYGVDVPLVLMNSFKTHETTAKIIRKYRMHNLTIHTFMQSCYPRVIKDTLQPMPAGSFSQESQEEWYPPGHGDVYQTLYSSGLLENLINQGKEYVFISNVDNLGATIDLRLLYHVVDSEADFALEVVQSTRADNEGGLLVGYGDVVKPKLLELSQLSKDVLDDFKKRFNLFNTNNIWANLRAIQRLVAKDELHLDVAVHERVVSGTRTIQLETFAGGAMWCFAAHGHKVLACTVPRSRYLPVKSTSDLFLVQSNLYSIKHGNLVMSPERPFRMTPLIKLGQEFSHVEDFLVRIPHGVPNIIELDHLTVAGDVTFGTNITLKGTVIIVANEGSIIMIPDGTVLKDKVVTGNLRILDH